MQVQMISLVNALIYVSQLLLSSFMVLVEANSSHKLVQQQIAFINSSSLSSPWLKKVANSGPRPAGCWNRPWICRRGEAPWTRMRCCRNRCVDVASDPNNCGLCGLRCPFSWHCCRAFCSNTNRSRFNCGRCGNRCPWGVRCVYGMCGYDQPRPRPCPLQPPPSPPPSRSCPPRDDQPPPKLL